MAIFAALFDDRSIGTIGDIGEAANQSTLTKTITSGYARLISHAVWLYHVFTLRVR